MPNKVKNLKILQKNEIVALFGMKLKKSARIRKMRKRNIRMDVLSQVKSAKKRVIVIFSKKWLLVKNQHHHFLPCEILFLMIILL